MTAPDVEFPSTWHLYCVGCNAWYDDADDRRACPTCGIELARSNSSTSETLVLETGSLAPPPPPPPPSKPHEDDSVVGRQLHVYQCVSLIGRGAMGRVYLAMHGDLQRHCALKILSPKRGHIDDDFIDRFLQEGRNAAALVHPNIVTVHAVGHVAEMHFLEMEFISGRSLQQLIRDEGPLSAERSLTLTMMIADGLAAAHRADIVHRDVKPDNVLMTRSGVAKIGDFGLAKRILNHRGEPYADGICGTPNYMAPELFQCEPATPASDVYALGVCLFQMLTGKLPQRLGSLAQMSRRGWSETIPSVRDFCPDISLEVAECVAMLTAKTPSDRPADAIAASLLLHAVLGQERDLESLIIEAFANERTVSWHRDGDRYRLTRLLPDQRRQTVYIEPSDDNIDERLLLLYSTCCPADPSFFEQALRRNSQMRHGSLAIREVDGRSQFVVIDTYPRSTVDPEEIRRSVLEIAAQADDVERQLTGQDRN